MDKLISCLEKLATKQITALELEKAFDEISILIFNHSVLVINQKDFLISEIEFYYYSEGHKDPYAHKRELQGEFGEWYFHKYSEIGKFLKTNRNGVDITFGNQSYNSYGGILLRKIQEVETPDMIVGINKVVREIIKNVGESQMDEIARGNGRQVFDSSRPLHLAERDSVQKLPIYKMQRHGLSFKDDPIGKDYYKRPLCYFNHDLFSEVIKVTNH